MRNRLALAVAVIAVGGDPRLEAWARPRARPRRVALGADPDAAALAGAGGARARRDPSPRSGQPAPAPASAPAPAPAPADARMTAAQAAAFDAWLIDAYKQCWTPPSALPEGEPYFPRVRVAFKSDGALAGAAEARQSAVDPAWRPHAEAALRAVKSCDPLHVPEKYAPYYPQWKTKTVYFDTARS